MPSITVQLSPEAEQQLRLLASRQGKSLEAYLGQLAEREATAESNGPNLLEQGRTGIQQRSSEQIEAARQRIIEATRAPREIPAGQTLLDVIEGKWPGSETDAEIKDALDRLS